MKRILLILFAVLLTGGMMLQAEPVSESRAREVAMKVLAAQPATKAAAADVKLIWDGEDAATKAAGNPAFYVFGSDRGGFVIVAGDDNVQPVLAISETSQFKVEGMPENVRWWMERMKAYVRSASAPTPEVAGQWAKFVDTKAAPIDPNDGRLTGKEGHKTPEWDQGNNDEVIFSQQIYNAMCPLDADDHWTVTGCVATSLGELLTVMSGIYHDDMPTKASVAQLDGYSVPAGYVPAAAEGSKYTLATAYDWENLRTLTDMTAINAAKTNTTLMDNLAHLLADLGAMVHARYRKNGTSANTELAPEAMAEYMGFNKGAYLDYESNYTTRQWKEKLKTELIKHPILYSGSGVYGGHAFLLDGYALFNGDTDMFYVNFGWSGVDNGYYVIDDFGDYNNYCEAAFDFYPKSGSSYFYQLQYSYFESTGGYVIPGMRFVTPFDKNNHFQIGISVLNTGSTEYEGKMRAKLLDKNDDLKSDFLIYSFTTEQFEEEVDIDPIDYSYADQTVYIKLVDNTTNIALGDKIVLYCTTDEAKTVFEPIKERNDGTVLNSLPLIPAAFIKADASYSVNDYFPLVLKNYDYVYAGTVWTFTKEGGSAVIVDQADREFQFTEAGTYKIEAAVKESATGAVVETITTYVTVN